MVMKIEPSSPPFELGYSAMQVPGLLPNTEKASFKTTQIESFPSIIAGVETENSDLKTAVSYTHLTLPTKA